MSFSILNLELFGKESVNFSTQIFKVKFLFFSMIQATLKKKKKKQSFQ